MEPQTSPPLLADPRSIESQKNPLSQLAAALSVAQGQIVPPKKTKKVDFTNNKNQRVKYSYADLADVIACVKEPLAKNGLSVLQTLGFTGGHFGITTVLLHTSGEFQRTWYPLPDPLEISPQSFGSALTYARRYTLITLLNVASEEDDDATLAETDFNSKKGGDQSGQGGQRRPPQQNNRPPVVKPNVTPKPEGSPAEKPWDGIMTQEQLAHLGQHGTAKGWTKNQIREYLMARWGLDTSKKLTPDTYRLFWEIIEVHKFAEAMEKHKAFAESQKQDDSWMQDIPN